MHHPPHPGAILREDVFPELDMSLTLIAKRLGVARVTLSRLLNERQAMSPSMALRLEKAGIGTAELWLGIQLQRNLWLASQEDLPAIEPIVPPAPPPT
ncbi:MAG: addiction module antidote protein, HigA family [Salinisphaeraceae bacterium]|nr:addiction module antidote protein, HigA family [Salinisphaeraceae bacterium]